MAEEIDLNDDEEAALNAAWAELDRGKEKPCDCKDGEPCECEKKHHQSPEASRKNAS